MDATLPNSANGTPPCSSASVALPRTSVNRAASSFSVTSPRAMCLVLPARLASYPCSAGSMAQDHAGCGKLQRKRDGLPEDPSRHESLHAPASPDGVREATPRLAGASGRASPVRRHRCGCPLSDETVQHRSARDVHHVPAPPLPGREPGQHPSHLHGVRARRRPGSGAGHAMGQPSDVD